MAMNANRKSPMRDNPQGNNDFCPVRFMDAQIRAVGESDERRFELSFSSEEAYERWYGLEILDHTESGVDLSRLNTMGVLLFNHSTNKVLGKVERAWIEGNRGKAVVVFDDDDESEVVRKKVASGTLKGVSVGYRVDVWEEVAAGKKSSDGRFSGPCYIAKRWVPLEISIATVPADPTVGVGRSYEPGRGDKVSLCERMIQVNENQVMLNSGM